MSLPPPPIQAWGDMPPVWRRWFQTVFAQGSVPDAVVTTAKLADVAVATAKIADANVTTAKLTDGAVATAKIANGAVTGPKLGIPGLVFPFAGSIAPTGTILCDGQAVSRTTYAALFAVIGTTWGTGDGSTTFNVPDLRGRAPLGAGQGSGLTNRVLGSSGGAESVTLTAAQSGVPAHVHPFNGTQSFKQSVEITTTPAGGIFAPATGATSNAGDTGSNATASASASHENMPPWAALNYVITT